MLKRATEQQWLQSVENTSVEWGSSLSLDLYEQREKMLRDETGMGRGFECWYASFSYCCLAATREQLG